MFFFFNLVYVICIFFNPSFNAEYFFFVNLKWALKTQTDTLMSSFKPVCEAQFTNPWNWSGAPPSPRHLLHFDSLIFMLPSFIFSCFCFTLIHYYSCCYLSCFHAFASLWFTNIHAAIFHIFMPLLHFDSLIFMLLSFIFSCLCFTLIH